MAFIRQHMMAGDPFTGGALQSRRKGAGAGPKAKAARHRAIRFARMSRMGDPFGGMAGLPAGYGKNAPAAKAGQFDWLKGLSANIGKAASAAAPLVKGALGSGFLGPAGVFASGLIPAGGAGTLSSGALASLQRRGAAPTGFGAFPANPMSPLAGIADGSFGGGKKRRSMNAANPKALRRAARRFEGFKALVKRVDKFMPSGAKFAPHHSAPSRKRGKR